MCMHPEFIKWCVLTYQFVFDHPPHLCDSGHACPATNNAVLCITKTVRHRHGKGNRPHCDNCSTSVCNKRLNTQRKTDGELSINSTHSNCPKGCEFFKEKATNARVLILPSKDLLWLVLGLKSNSLGRDAFFSSDHREQAFRRNVPQSRVRRIAKRWRGCGSAGSVGICNRHDRISLSWVRVHFLVRTVWVQKWCG